MTEQVVEYCKRPKPIWISSRVPANINCPKCGSARGAKFVTSPATETYQYNCSSCGAVVVQTLADLNRPVVTYQRIGA